MDRTAILRGVMTVVPLRPHPVPENLFRNTRSEFVVRVAFESPVRHAMPEPPS